jgi:hypothetical protein
LRYKRWLYEVAEKAGTVSVLDTLTTEDIPEEMRAVKEKIDHIHGAMDFNDPIRKAY